MLNQIRSWARALWTGMGLIPGLIALGSFLLAVFLSGLMGYTPVTLRMKSAFDPDAAAAVLTALAGGAITVAALVLSITMVVLSSASAQFGPRLLPNFIRKNGTKVAMGGFVGSFVYQIVVASALGLGGRVPDFAVWVGIGGSLAAFAILLAFVHMVARFIQVPFIIDEVTSDLRKALAKRIEAGEGGGRRFKEIDREWKPIAEVRAKRDGYIEMIDIHRLRQRAESADLMVRCEVRAGSFVPENGLLAVVMGEKVQDDPGDWNVAFVLSPNRTAVQDVEFAVRQLVEVAARALSPGINDPYTAINAIERLGGALSEVAGRHLPDGLWHDEDGRLRLVVPLPDVAGILDAAYHPLRQHARHMDAVAIALIDSYLSIASLPTHPDFKVGLRRHADLLRDDFQRLCEQPADFAEFDTRHAKLIERLG
ncbi:MAG: DUF2254 domain-containing protein [Akkermansiaceae bacterium]|nr:DUF2254 domain-containing protein [Akkermansiaceae bacterium]